MGDAPHLHRGQNTPRGLLYSVALITVGIAICSVTLVVSVDALCVASVNEWVPVYPGSEEVEEWHNMFRAKGMGISEVTYMTEDPLIEVIRWYQDHQASFSQQPGRLGVVVGRNSLADSHYRLTELEEGGTQIQISSECAYN
ncbi:hypothetical protein G4Y79_24195 [Phototrophicus methaneseepsis]|uniref:Uncharacterized protein n=1 Tax=Phototrophicus methaneseepsis TaxID=2710758 RepID=A0A7S8E9B0_9CHLR|nr:hypothetical protein [Phototrophicus methaneseepsis]QPC82747.1 hypothetical protein G4Y79_24195 [Phototrophicus methaneseepsis]